MMKVYQCIRAYDLYIPAFENKYRIKESKYTFSELRNLIIKDGFAATYILKPAFEEHSNDFFFTLWNYKTLQYKWAEENGIKTTNLDEIRIAQIEDFKPDIYYNFSPYHDNITLHKILNKKDLVKICWDAVIEQFPLYHEKYDLRATLFEPYVKFWKQHGFKSSIIPPAFPESWDILNQSKKDIDILFYGQYNEHYFSGRNLILTQLISWSKSKGYKLNIHLQYPNRKKPLINMRGFKRYMHWLPVAPKIIREFSKPSVYGKELFETIARSKIVVNAFTNYNGMFKDNMRNYESIGCGAFLISEDGIYPEHFIPNKDFYTYRSVDELFIKIEKVMSEPDQGMNLVQQTREKLKTIYSKEAQWNSFVNAVNSLV